MRKNNGFTLIELLVAIAIIAIIGSFLFANFVGVRERGRDAQRKSDMRQIQSALEIYRSDTGNYPSSVKLASCGGSFNGVNNTSYMKKVPCDPFDKTVYTYTALPSAPACDESTSNLCNSYTLSGCLENANDPEIDKDANGNKISCASGNRWKYTLQNP